MRIAILTADEPLYLPAFFHQLLTERAKDVAGVFVCQPLYKNQTTLSMLKRYVRTFGLANAFRLAVRVAGAKLKDKLGSGASKGKFHSVPAVCRKHGVNVFFPQDVNSPETLEQIRSLGADLVLSISCPQIFKDDLIRLPAKGCLNLHGSDLPDYRGIMPSFWMLANGEKQAGTTLFFVNAGIDTGDVAGKRFFAIEPSDTLDSFIVRSKKLGCEMVLDVLGQIDSGTVKRTPLTGTGRYFGWPTREAYLKFRQAGRRMW